MTREQHLEHLLGKYAAHIVGEEGVDYLDFTPSWSGIAFAPEEVAEIRTLADRYRKCYQRTSP